MRFSFPAAGDIFKQLSIVTKRFPLVILSALTGVIAAIALQYIDESSDSFGVLLKTAFFGFWGISFFIAGRVLVETIPEKRIRLSLQIIFPALFLIYYLLMGADPTLEPLETWYRFGFFVLTTHLLVAVAPFLRKKDSDAFWMYNKTLFLRALLSALYSGVLFIGLTIALLAMDALLGLDLDDKLILALFFTMAGLFNTFFFLSGVPEDPQQPGEMVFPKGLRIFTQFILIPLVTVYILILYTYMIRIVLQWELPNGWVANLILIFSIAGILSLLLLYPVRDNAGHRWVSWYSRGYYLALVPLIALLMVSIWVRMDAYGVTINRFLVATLAVWLTGMVAYFLLSKQRDIRVIPFSLMITALLISGGPLGAFQVSERSQTNRFESLMKKNGRLSDEGKILIPEDRPTAGDIQQISSVVMYLNEHHGYQVFKSYLGDDIPDISDDEDNADHRPGTFRITEKLMEQFGLPYLNSFQDPDDQLFTPFTLMAEEGGVLAIGAFEYHVNDVRISRLDDSLSVTGLPENWIIGGNLDSGELVFRIQGKDPEIHFDLMPLIRERLSGMDSFASGMQALPAEDLMITTEVNSVTFLLAIRNISGTFGEQVRIEHITADLFYR